jgi:hypothetical protein
MTTINSPKTAKIICALPTVMLSGKVAVNAHCLTRQTLQWVDVLMPLCSLNFREREEIACYLIVYAKIN